MHELNRPSGAYSASAPASARPAPALTHSAPASARPAPALALALVLALCLGLMSCSSRTTPQAEQPSPAGQSSPDAAASPLEQAQPSDPAQHCELSQPSEASEAKTGAEPIVLIVAGFAGDANGEGALPYREDLDWHDLAFEDGAGVAAYFSGQSRGAFTWIPARETSAFGAGGNTCAADAADDGIVHITLPRAHGHWFAPERPAEASFDESLASVIEEAGSYVDFASYDANGNNRIDTGELGVVVMFAGYDADGYGMDSLDDAAYPRIQAHTVSFLEGGSGSGDTFAVDNAIVMAESRTCAPDGSSLDVPATGAPNGPTTDAPDASAHDEPAHPGAREQAPNSLGTLIHELGHHLGLPDYYDTSYDADAPWAGWTPGPLSAMDYGFALPLKHSGEGGEGDAGAGDDNLSSADSAGSADSANPADSSDPSGPADPSYGGLPDGSSPSIAQGPATCSLDAFSLAKLGWIEPQRITETGTYEVRSAEAAEGKNVLRVDSGRAGEYFLIENRQPTGQDTGLSGLFDGRAGGIVIWHVDENVYESCLASNQVNLPLHRPALTVQYLMSAPDDRSSQTPAAGNGAATAQLPGNDAPQAHTLSLTDTATPDPSSAFWDASSAKARFAELGVDALELWVYGNGESANNPQARTYCGIHLAFPDESSDVMHVEIRPDNT